MTAATIPLFARASRKDWASFGAIGFVLASIRGLREKIWIASHPTARPREGARAMLSEIEMCAPRYTASPEGGIRVRRMSFAEELPPRRRPRSRNGASRLD